MPKSIINSTYEYNEDVWIVSHVNLGPLLGGHSALIVEGLRRSSVSVFTEPFIGQYDINAIGFEEGTDSISKETESDPESLKEAKGVIQSLKNTKGMITKIRCFEGDKPGREYPPGCGKSRSVPALQAQRMIASIKQQQVEVGSFMQKLRGELGGVGEGDVETHLRKYGYQKYGNYPFLTNIQDGDNCTSWCNKQMVEAGIIHEGGKPVPKKAAGQCLIL